MNQQHRWQRHVLTLWGRRSCNERARILERAVLRDEAEQRVARTRLLEWATTQLPVVVERRTPLLTPGQARRGNGAES
jgi:hypothetical protein